MGLNDPKQIMDVWGAPADYSRAIRRTAGLYGRFWKWDAQALGADPDLPPRYVRRHHAPEVLTNPKTRRERKHRARIMRAMTRKIA